MKMPRRSMLALVALAGLALPAAAAAAEAKSCFRMSRLQGTHADGTRTIYAREGVDTFWRLDLAHPCYSLPFATEGLVMTPAGGRDLICGPLDLDLKVANHGAFEACSIKSITKLTPEEAAAIPKKARP